MYNEKVMEAFKNPKNVGEVENYDGLGKVGNAACGDIMQITLKIDNDVITDAKFKTFGCAAAIATSSTATEMVKGMTVDEALKLTNKKVVEDTLQFCFRTVEDEVRVAKCVFEPVGGESG